MNKQSLYNIQYWMKTAFISGRSMQERLHFPLRKYGQEKEQFTESEQFTERRQFTKREQFAGNERRGSTHRNLDTHSSGDLLRLVDCLKSDFPDLYQFLGGELFNILAKAYVATLPSASRNLYDLGEKFSDFLCETSSKSYDGTGSSFFWELPEQIARLERAKAEVLMAKGAETKIVKTSPLSDLGFGYSDHDRIVKTPPCLKLVQLNYPVHKLLKAFEAEKETPLSTKREITLLAITQLNYHLQVTELEIWQYEFLAACAEECSVYQAAQRSAQESQLRVSTILSHLFMWLPVAQKNGYLIFCDAPHLGHLVNKKQT